MSTLDKVKQLVPIQFKYKQDKEQLVRAGFSAQQVQQLFPDAVTTVDGVLHIKLNVLQTYIEQAYNELPRKN